MHEARNLVVGLCRALRILMGENPIASLAILVNFKDTFDKFVVREGKSVQFLAYWRSDGS